MRISDWSSDVCSSDLVETLRLLLVAIARQVRAPDEAGRAIVADLHFKAAVADFQHRDGDDLVLARAGSGSGSGRSATLKLLHAKRDALLLDIDVQNHGLNRLALMVQVARVLARNAPADVRHVDLAVHIAYPTDDT